MGKGKSLIPVERIEKAILFFRGQKVLVDSDLAALYDVETKALNRAVKRNIERFPEDFMFQLTKEEWEILRCHIGTSNGKTPLRLQDRPSISSSGGRRYPPYVFTEQGVAMLSSVLRSDRAVKVNIEIMRAFVRLREILASNSELARKLDALEKKYDAQFRVVFDAIRELMAPPTKEQRRIGFRTNDK